MVKLAVSPVHCPGLGAELHLDLEHLQHSGHGSIKQRPSREVRTYRDLLSFGRLLDLVRGHGSKDPALEYGLAGTRVRLGAVGIERHFCKSQCGSNEKKKTKNNQKLASRLGMLGVIESSKHQDTITVR